MHSSRMCTARFSGRVWDVSTHLDGVCLGVSTWGSGQTMGGGGYLPHILPMWTEGMTQSCENITLHQTSFAGGNKT